MVELKENAKLTKVKLLDQGRSLMVFLERANELNKDIKEFERESFFNVENQRDSLTVGTNDLRDALEMITSEIGKLELKSTKEVLAQ